MTEAQIERMRSTLNDCEERLAKGPGLRVKMRQKNAPEEDWRKLQGAEDMLRLVRDVCRDTLAKQDGKDPK